LLARGDRALITKDVDLVINLYELAGADRSRWEKVVDVLVVMPERKRQASRSPTATSSIRARNRRDAVPRRRRSKPSSEPGLARSVAVSAVAREVDA